MRITRYTTCFLPLHPQSQYQAQLTSSLAVHHPLCAAAAAVCHPIWIEVPRRARRHARGRSAILLHSADAGGASRYRRLRGGHTAMERRVEEQRGGGGGDGRRFGVRRVEISGERLDLRSSFGLCYCGYIEGTLFTFLSFVVQKYKCKAFFITFYLEP